LTGAAAGLALARFALGLGEAGNFPASIKAVAEWFPKKERALATGIFNSGANIGAVVAPIMVPWILGAYGWQEAFLITGALGFVWLIFWWRYYELPAKQSRVNQAEFDYIHSDNEPDTSKESPVKWLDLFKIRQTWYLVKCLLILSGGSSFTGSPPILQKHSS
jgi:ACS family hexuronate transporter-like MFS transporter